VDAGAGFLLYRMLPEDAISPIVHVHVGSFVMADRFTVLPDDLSTRQKYESLGRASVRPYSLASSLAATSLAEVPNKHFPAYAIIRGVGKTRSRVIAILVVLVVVATSIALRKTLPDQTTRSAIGIVEVVIIAIVMFRAFGRR